MKAKETNNTQTEEKILNLKNDVIFQAFFFKKRK